MTDEQTNPHNEEAAAIDRIARTHDGLLLHRYLRRVLETVHDLESDGALRQAHGRRSLARDLMRLMAPGIEGTSGRSADSPILTRASQPVARGSLTERRRAQWATERERDPESQSDAP